MTKKETARFRRRRLGRYAWNAKKTFVPGILIEGFAVVADLLAPYLVGIMLNRQVLEAGVVNPRDYLKLLLYFFLAVLAGSILRYVSGLLLQYTANDISRLMQLDVFSHLQNLPIAYFDRLPAGKVVSRVTNDTKSVRNLFGGVLVRLLMSGIYAFGIYVTLAVMDWRLFVLALLPVPVMGLAIWDFRRKSIRYMLTRRRLLSEINSTINEDIQGMDVIQSLNRQDRVQREFEETNEAYYKMGIKVTWLWAYSAHTLSSALGNLMLAFVLFYFGFGQLSGNWYVPLGSLYVFIDYMQRLIGQFNQVMHRMGDLEQAKGAADHVFELLQEPTITQTDGDLPPLDGAIDFDDVTFAYIDEDVLKDVSFSVAPGETVAFVGPTGSGKSTIMNLLFGFYRMDRGDIVIDGSSLKDLPILALRRQMAIVLQDPYLFTGTLYSNISLNKPEITEAMAIRALEEVGGGPLLARLEKGIHSPVTERGQSFSTGERQLISFARALAQNPKILVLDEATANVDSETEALIQYGIKKLEQGRTTLLIAHRLSTVREASQIFVLENGRIKERGNHAELMALGGIYAAMYEEQSKSVS